MLVPPRASADKACEKKEPRAASKVWWSPEQSDPNMQEILFMSLLLCVSSENVSSLDIWVQKALAEEHDATDRTMLWQPSKERWPLQRNISSIYTPLVHAFEEYSWPRDVLDAVGLAMQAWRGDGQVDGLSGQALATYISRPPLAPGLTKKKPGAKRYKTWAVVRVARFLRRHGVALRKLLKLDAESDEAKPAYVVIAELDERIGELEADLARERAAVKRIQDAWRKAAGRLKQKNEAVTKARDEERAKLQPKLKAARVEIRVEEMERAEAHKSDELETARRLKREAHARARARTNETEKLERKVRKLEKEIEEMDVEEEADDEKEDDGGFVTYSTYRLAFELMPRRDEAGRWQAEAPEIRTLRWAQLARGVAPMTVCSNLQDAICMLAPGVDVPAMSKSQIRALRGEVTLAGEAMAAWKFAACKRVMTFGWDESTKFGDSVFGCNFQVEHADGTIEDICLRGLSILPEGGTSAKVLAHIEKRILSYSRRILTEFMDAYEKANGKGSWAADGGPDPENIGLHRLCEDTVLMTDTCNGARCTKRMLAQAIMATIEEKVGAAKWEAMTADERNAKYKVRSCLLRVASISSQPPAYLPRPALLLCPHADHLSPRCCRMCSLRYTAVIAGSTCATS